MTQAPEPKRRGRPKIESPKSERMAIRVAPDLREKADRLSQLRGLSRNEWLEEKIREAQA